MSAASWKNSASWKSHLRTSSRLQKVAISPNPHLRNFAEIVQETVEHREDEEIAETVSSVPPPCSPVDGLIVFESRKNDQRQAHFDYL